MLLIGLIYCATNKVNGKKYIGLTHRGLDNRKRRHKECLSNNYQAKWKFHRAIRKYGWDNFEWEVLENGIEDDEQLFKKEKYYIKKYDTFNKGYNMTLGGDGVGSGENNPNTKYSDETVKEVIGYICNTNLTQLEISEIVGVPRSLVKDVSEKKYRVQCWEGKENPRKAQVIERVSLKLIDDIIVDIKEGKLSNKDISNKYGVSYGVVSGITTGKHYRRRWDFEEYNKERDVGKFRYKGENHYRTKYRDEKLIEMKEDMLRGRFKTKDISDKYGVDMGYVSSFIRRETRNYLMTEEESKIIKLNRGNLKKKKSKKIIKPMKEKSVRDKEKEHMFEKFYIKGEHYLDVSYDLKIPKLTVWDFLHCKSNVDLFSKMEDKFRVCVLRGKDGRVLGVSRCRKKSSTRKDIEKVFYEYFVEGRDIEDVYKRNNILKVTVNKFINREIYKTLHDNLEIKYKEKIVKRITT